MDLYRINLNLLVALDVLLTERSVTVAASKLFITQAAMSNNLQQLRKIFKDDLLLREKNQMVLTTYAKELQPKLHQVLQELHSIVVIGQRFDPKTSKRLFKIGMSDYVASLILPRLLSYLQQHAPNIKIQISNAAYFSSAEPFEQGIYDLGIGKIFSLSDKLLTHVLFIDTAVCILSHKHPLAKKKKLTLDDYISSKHIAIINDDAKVQTITDTVLDELGVRRDIRIGIPFVASLLKIIESSDDLIGSIVKSTAELYRENHHYVIKPMPFDFPEVKFCLVWHKRDESDLGSLWLRQVINQLMNEL